MVLAVQVSIGRLASTLCFYTMESLYDWIKHDWKKYGIQTEVRLAILDIWEFKMSYDIAMPVPPGMGSNALCGYLSTIPSLCNGAGLYGQTQDKI